MQLRSIIKGSLMLALSFTSAVASADAPPVTVTAAPEPVKVLYGSAGIGSVLSTPHGAVPSAQGSLHFTLPFGHYVAVELHGTLGYSIGTSEPNDLWARLGLGVRVEKNNADFSPYGALRLVHLHYAPAEVWWEHPGASIAGSSASGIQHSSGMAAAFGVTWVVPSTDRRLRAMAELEGSWIPIGNAPEWFTTTEVGLGYAF
jgi:hypothetical protein